MWKLNNSLKQSVGQKKKNHRVIRKYLHMSENENKTYQNFWDAVNAVLRRKFISVNA